MRNSLFFATESGIRSFPNRGIIIEYLDRFQPRKAPHLPAEPERAQETRLQDRFYDLYVHEPMQKIVGDKLRPEGKKDPHGVAQATELIETAYGVIESKMATRTWASDPGFSMADCAAAPALYYANRLVPLGRDRQNAAAYLSRLQARPSVRRVMTEAEPYFHLFPG